MREITTAEFKDEIFDFMKKSVFKLKGNKPVIIDFKAEWCGPCKMVSPILEELQEEYKDQIDIFKVDVDNEHEIARSFGVRSIPSMLFAPIEGDPQMSVGTKPKSALEDAIHDVLKVG